METEAALAVRMVLAIGLAWALTFTFGRRLLRLDLRGAGVVGGVCAGIALGPMVLGKVTPAFYEKVNVGGAQQQEMIEATERAYLADIHALEESGVTEIAIAELRSELHWALLALQKDRASLRAWHRDLPLAIASSLGLIALMLGAMRERGASLDGIRIGAVTAAIAALAWAVVARRLLGVDLALAAVIGGTLAAGSVWTRGSWRMGFGLTGLMVAVLALTAGDAFGAAWRAFVTVALGLVLGRVVRFGPTGDRRSMWVVHGLMVPAVASVMVSSCDLSQVPGSALWFVLLAGVLGADLHFLAAFLALGWLGRGWRQWRPMTAWHNAYAQGFGGTQIVLANLVLAFGLMERRPEIAGVLGFAAAAMAVTGEITRPATHKALAKMRGESVL